MVLGVIFMVIVPLCAAGVIRANRFVGIRWPVLRTSEEAWQRGHRAAIAPTYIGSLLAIAAGIGLSFVPDSGALAPIGSFVFLLSGFAIASSRAQRAAA